MKKTKIVCTLGPATDDINVLDKIVQLGMDVARLNFSHGDHEEHLKRFEAIKQLREKYNRPVAIMLDTKGPEIRIGRFQNGSATLHIGDQFTLDCENVQGDETQVSLTYANLCNEIEIGTTILIDDGLIKLSVIEIEGTKIRCIVENGGELKNNKSINIPDFQLSLPSITDKDIDDLRFGITHGIDFVAASFVRTGEDVLNIRNALEENGGGHIQIISKVESSTGVDHIDDIIELSDGIMVAREISVSKYPRKKCRSYRK